MIWQSERKVKENEQVMDPDAQAELKANQVS
jgi:hypothetical protein